ncbi:Lens fiber membrane intrinsic protein, partial [Ophiophagus hannah]
MNRYKETLSKWPIIVWFKNLKVYDWVRLSGIFFSCVATCLLMIAICTEYWVKRFVRGIFVFRGLWTDCQLGHCSLLEEIPFYITISIVLMLISAIACYGSVIYGTRSLAATETSKKLSHSDIAITLSFFSGVCHFVAKRWEEEETAEALTTTEVFTPWAEDPSKKKTQDSGSQKR